MTPKDILDFFATQRDAKQGIDSWRPATMTQDDIEYTENAEREQRVRDTKE